VSPRLFTAMPALSDAMLCSGSTITASRQHNEKQTLVNRCGTSEASRDQEAEKAGLTFGLNLRVGGVLRRRKLPPYLVLVLLRTTKILTR
jgi:hypothetical protein